MVPPWVPDVNAPAGAGDGPATPAPAAPDAPQVEPAAAPAADPTKVAADSVSPSGRFGPARTSLGKFARGGDSTSMRRGLGGYVRKGYGGSGTATKRFGGSAQTAGVLYGALGPGASGQISLPGGQLDAALLEGRSAETVMNAVVDAVRPVDGTQDAEASRYAIKEALSELLVQFPDAELLDLTEAQRLFAVERYLAQDVYRRFELDVGMAIQKNAPTLSEALSRLKEVKEYIKETVAAAVKKVGAPAQMTARAVARLATSVLQETFKVFESYA